MSPLQILLGIALACTAPTRADNENLGLGGDLVAAWNETFLVSVQGETSPPCQVARHLALLHIAIHDALNAAEPRFAPWREWAPSLTTTSSTSPPPAPSGLHAALRAAHTIATTLCPSRQSAFDALLTQQSQAIYVTSGRSAQLGSELGLFVARGLLAHRQDDGSATTLHYVPSDQPGHWRRPPSSRPPELPAWGRVRPFCLSSPNQFRPPGPPPPHSEQGRADLETVRRLGAVDSSERTPEQTLAARFWADFSYTNTPPGHWNEIARDALQHRPLDLHQTARLFAWLNLALADAAIAAWDCKYHFNSWRPETALASESKDWRPLLPSPPHPEYVSGHSAFSGAAAAVLEHVFGVGEGLVQARSFDVPGVVRSWQSFAACRDEVGLSRIWGGIHFPSANEHGKHLGGQVATVVLQCLQEPMPVDPRRLP